MKKKISILAIFAIITLLSCEKESSNLDPSSATKTYDQPLLYTLNGCVKKVSGDWWFGATCDRGAWDECPNAIDCVPMAELSANGDVVHTPTTDSIAIAYGYDSMDSLVIDVQNGDLRLGSDSVGSAYLLSLMFD